LAAEAEPLLAARGVSRRFGDRVALQPTDLELRPRETLALIGPNGAGKSTLLALLGGTLAPLRGDVERPVRAAVLPQGADALPADVPAVAFVRAQVPEGEARRLLGHFGLEGGGDVDALLAEFGLPGDAIAGELSVGNRQRLNVAIALLGSPQVLLLDEPTASLDPEQRARLWRDVVAVPASGGAVCFVTQHHEELALADRVLELQDGRLVA